MNNKIFKKSVLAVIVSTGIALTPTYANAGIFDAIGGFIEDVGEWVVGDAGGWIEDTGETAINEAAKITKIAINETGDFVDEAGNVISDAAATIYLDELFEISTTTGLAILKDPVESTEQFKNAMLKGDWESIVLDLRDEGLKIGAFAGKSASEIESGLEDFGDEVGGAFEEAGEFIVDSEAMKQIGKGLEVIRGALATCLGSAEAVEYCYDQFVGQIIAFYNMMRDFVVKVTDLKGYAKGDMFDQIVGVIEEIERKSVKYFMPVLESNQDKLNFDQTGSPFADNSSVHERFEQYGSIQAIRNSLAATSYSYHNSPATACARVAIPIVCDDYVNLNDHTVNRFNYLESGLSSTESAERQQLFHALNMKAFGVTYRNSSNVSRSDSEKELISDYLQSELYADIDWSNDDQRIPYIVENEMLEGAGGAFISTDTDAIILLNEQLFEDDNSLATGFNEEDVMFAQGVALEEIGHWLNWRRCQYDNAMMGCASAGETFGDPGLKFSNASFIDYTSASDYLAELPNISEGAWSKPAQLTLTSGDIAIYEGNPGLADLQDALAAINSKIRFRMRAQLGVSDGLADLAKVGSTGIIEVNYTPPKRIKAGDLDDMGRYGYSDANQTLYSASIGVNFAIENYVGAPSEFLSFFAIPMPTPIGDMPAITTSMKLYGEVGIKSTLGISFPLLKDTTNYYDGFVNVNNNYLENNIKLSFSVSPYAFGYQSIVKKKLSSVDLQLDQTASAWLGVTTSWPANTATIPISITMAGISIASSGVGCLKGIALFSSITTSLSQPVQCALGAQIASGTVVSGAGALFSLFDPNITFEPGAGWVHGIRVKAGFPVGNASAGIETRFEALNKRWDRPSPF